MNGTSLTISGLTKRFGSHIAVDALDLHVESGEVFGLLGPNGAGKTSVVRMICGFLSPDQGEIHFDGEPGESGESGDSPEGNPRRGAPSRTADTGVRHLRHLVGVCPQEIVIWEQLSCIEQLVFIAGMYGIRAKPARKKGMQLLEALDLGSRAQQRGATLSGGMKRRLNLLLALAHDPPIVLLDEPEAGLDPQSRILVRDFVKGLARRKTVILTSHNMDEVDRVADRVGIMNEGKLLVVDTPAAIKSKSGLGDALRIEISPCDDGVVASGVASLRAITVNGTSVSVEALPAGFVVRSPHVVDVVADAVNALRSLRIGIRSMAIRENTLEDAFISLTGRSLSCESTEAVSQERP